MPLIKGQKYPQIGITNKENYGEDYYKTIGSKGGKVSNPDKPKGFAYMKANDQLDKIKAAGQKGGRISKRKSAHDYK
tara:strand:- start:483 stop:713 length:231 start_codon:yes stop_codon:yes gene_type:complete